MPVVRLIDEPEDEELRDLYERLSGASSAQMGILNIFKIIAHNPRLLRAWLRMGTLLLAPGGITLSPRLREIAILRVAQTVRQRVRVRPAHPHRRSRRPHRGRDQLAPGLRRRLIVL